jgi:RND family efflux transporter MFP subunit
MALVLLAGCSQPTQERLVDLTVPVTVRPVGVGTIESVYSATGTLRPIHQAKLITEIQGKLFWIDGEDGPLADGVEVVADQLLARLENKEWVVQARLDARKLERDNAGRVLKEKEVLLERGVVIEMEAETARQDLANAEANLQDTHIQLAKVLIKSPISGFLTALTDATVGTLIPQGTLLGTVMDYSQVLVDLQIPNSQIQAVELDKEVRVVNYAYPDHIFTGTITAANPALDPTTRTFRVVATVDNEDLLLRPGMFVKADIVTESLEDVVLIPRQYVLMRRNQEVVFVEEGARAQMRQIITGLEDQDRVEIIEGLEEGERLITSNYETLRSRTRVRVTGESDAN